TEEDVRRARRAYFANISYLDAEIGALLDILDASGQEAVILFVSDHGDMLGERGLWFKMSFHEGSARVPLTLHAPGVEPRRVETPVSLLDVVPTLAELAGIDLDAIAPWIDGRSLLAVAGGEARGPVPMEYMAEGSVAPMIALRDGRWKYTACPADPEQLFDLEADPDELDNRAPAAAAGSDPQAAEALARLRAEAARRWDLARIDAEVRASQARRLVVYEALRKGAYFPWDFEPLQRASERYMRNHLDLNVLESSRRFPRGE
ncbi:MAG: choline-sulfatase, partial [Alphaproteobacteria bacterium]